MNTENRKTILIVDDVELNRDILSDILSDEYECMMAANGAEALDVALGDFDISAILLDLIMPEMSGVDVLKILNDSGRTKEIPVIILSAANDTDTINQCYELGAFEFLSKPFEPTTVKLRLRNAIASYTYKTELEKQVEIQTEELSENYKKLKRINEDTIELVGIIAEAHDNENGAHTRKVRKCTEIIGKQYMHEFPDGELTEESLAQIAIASMLHDIGKIMIPDNILYKDGTLTEEEFEIVKSHTTKGADLLKYAKHLIADDIGRVAYEICMFHHEKWDGSGYPYGLKEDEIPFSAQLVSIADSYAVLAAAKPYRAAIPHDEAVIMILNGECGQFNPKLIQAFRHCAQELA